MSRILPFWRRIQRLQFLYKKLCQQSWSNRYFQSKFSPFKFLFLGNPSQKLHSPSGWLRRYRNASKKTNRVKCAGYIEQRSLWINFNRKNFKKYQKNEIRIHKTWLVHQKQYRSLINRSTCKFHSLFLFFSFGGLLLIIHHSMGLMSRGHSLIQVYLGI